MWRKAERQRNIVDKEQWSREQRQAGHDSVALREERGVGKDAGRKALWRKDHRKTIREARNWHRLPVREVWERKTSQIHFLTAVGGRLKGLIALLLQLLLRPLVKLYPAQMATCIFPSPVTHFWDGHKRAEGSCPAMMPPVRMACKHPWA